MRRVKRSYKLSTLYRAASYTQLVVFNANARICLPAPHGMFERSWITTHSFLTRKQQRKYRPNQCMTQRLCDRRPLQSDTLSATIIIFSAEKDAQKNILSVCSASMCYNAKSPTKRAQIDLISGVARHTKISVMSHKK